MCSTIEDATTNGCLGGQTDSIRDGQDNPKCTLPIYPVEHKKCLLKTSYSFETVHIALFNAFDIHELL